MEHNINQAVNNIQNGILMREVSFMTDIPKKMAYEEVISYNNTHEENLHNIGEVENNPQRIIHHALMSNAYSREIMERFSQ